MPNYQALTLAFLLAACGQSDHASQPEAARQLRTVSNDAMQQEDFEDDSSAFLKMAQGDSWAKPPVGTHEDAASDGKPCERVSEAALQKAIDLLTKSPAVPIDADKYRQLTGTPTPSHEGTLYLLRGFSTVGSSAHVRVTGTAVTVHSDALGGLHKLRRHPCIAALKTVPSEVYTVASYDL